MPSFFTRPKSHGGIAASVRALLSSSPNLSEADILRGHAAAASAEHNTALTEQVRLKMERDRQAEALRNDPKIANEYGSRAAGITDPEGTQLSQYLKGAVIPPATPNDDEGNPMPAAGYARPDITPGAQRGYETAIASLIANRLAPGKTNAEQLTHGGGNLLTQAVERAMSEAETIPEANQLGQTIGRRPLEPFRRGANAQGVIVDSATGDVTTESGIHDAAVAAAETLATKRTADATKGDRPRQAPVRTAAQEGRDRAYAASQGVKTEGARLELLRQKQSSAKSKFRNDRNMKGNTLGNWIPDAGYEVLDKNQKVIGHYD